MYGKTRKTGFPSVEYTEACRVIERELSESHRRAINLNVL